MGHVIGVLIGLVATAVYAVGAAEFLLGQTGVDLLEPARGRVPPDILVWLTRVPLEAPEGAPTWRAVVVSIALASGIAGSLFLIVKARLSAVLLWLSFMLLLGVLVGQDLVRAGGFEAADQQQLITLGGTLGAALIFALIANIVTSRPREEEVAPAGYVHADRVRELIRSDAPQRRRSPFADPDPPPARLPDDPEPAPEPVQRRAALSDEPGLTKDADLRPEPPPEPRLESRLEPRPASEPTDLLQTDDLVPAKT